MKKTMICLMVAAGAFWLADVMLAERSDLPMSVGEPLRLPAEERVSQALFGALHERTVDSFSKRVGFGFSRLGALPKQHISVEDLWTILPPEAAGYDVALIGLENEPSGRVYKVSPSEPRQVQQQQQGTPAGTGIEAQLLATVSGELVELTTPPREVEITPASPLDLEMIDRLAADLPAPMLTDGGDKVMVYGAVRARQQRCIACHECEPDTLLGAFRYTFQLPPSSGEVEVAMAPER